MAKVQKIKTEVKSAIQRKSAYSLPNNPTDAGYKADDIRKAFYKPIIDTANSALTEIDRVIDELNGILEYSQKQMDSVESVSGIYFHGADGIIYTFSDNKFTVSGYEGDKTDLTIPQTVLYQGVYYPVVAIGSSAFGGALKSVEIPSSVANVYSDAFKNCSSLASVKFLGKTNVSESNTFTSGKINFSVPKEYLTVYQMSLASYKKSLTGFDTITSNANDIISLYQDKLTRVDLSGSYDRVYLIEKTGKNSTKDISSFPLEGKLPIYLENGVIKVGNPIADDDATSKKYVEDRLEQIGGTLGVLVSPDISKIKEGNYLCSIKVLSDGSQSCEVLTLGSKIDLDIIKRNKNGTFSVPSPISGDNPANKDYVNSQDNNLEIEINKLREDKISVTPNGTDNFFDENSKINLKYVSDVLLGQLVFGGTICGTYWNGNTNEYVLITYSENGKAKLNKTVNTEHVKLKDLDASEYEGVYFIAAKSYNTSYSCVLPVETIAGEGYVSGQWVERTINYDSGDWVLSNGSEWQVVDNTDAVRTVAGKIGNVILNTSDIVGLDDKLSALTPQNVGISIPVDSWNDSTGTSPFLKYALVNVNFSDNATISLVNNDPITFANYGFCIDISSTNTLLKVLSLGTPTEDVMLILEVYNEN